MSEILKTIYGAVMEGGLDTTQRDVRAALDDGISAGEIVDVAPEAFLGAARSGANMIGLSALLTTTMHSMEAVIRAIEGAGTRGSLKIIVGGAPVTDEYARRIDADGFAPDASQAAAVATTLLSQ